MDEFTRKFNAAEDKEQQVHYVLTTVYESLKEKGYDPINQIDAVSAMMDAFVAYKLNIEAFD